jgi:hypothetical protein
MHGARAIGKFDPVSRRDSLLQRFGLPLSGGDGGETESGSFFDYEAGLAPLRAEAAGNGKTRERGGRVERTARHGGALPLDR